ncbi:MAG: hypothetical protein NVSMB17_05390 [Candidatus Dormibacteria bacterium]
MAPLALVLAAFAGAAVVIPTMTAVTISDDWVYTRSVEILLRQHQFRVLDLSTANVGLQVIWAALFAWLLGLSPGALRLSTVTMAAIGGVAVYGVCRELRVDRVRAAVGTAMVLFNPLALALAYTFMTDVHYLALMAIAVYGYLRGLGRRSMTWTLVGAVAAGLALLSRQQGALLPIATVAWLLLVRRHQGRRLWASILAVVSGPIVIAGSFYLLAPAPGSGGQSRMIAEIGRAGPGGVSTMVAELVFVGLMYAAFFAAPLVVSALPAVARSVRGWRRRRWAVAVSTVVVLGLGLIAFAPSHMPYVPHFLGTYGLGPNDLLTGRHPLFLKTVLTAATFACAVVALGLVLLLASSVPPTATGTEETGAAPMSLLVALALSQCLGVIPPSIYFRDWTVDGIHSPSLDRYLLPLLPFAVWLAVSATQRLRTTILVPALLTAAMAVVSVAGTRDFLAWHQQIWAMAAEATRDGVALDALDGGASWDGYHVGEESINNGIPVHTPGGKWWLYLYSPRIDSTYVISMKAEPGYDVVWARPYRPWLGRRSRPETMYLLRRRGAAGAL